MCADSAISLMRMRSNGGRAAAKLRRDAGLFELISIKLKYLHVILADLSVLRNRCDELAAKWGHRNWRLGARAAASGFLRGGRMATMGSRCERCHEIAENIPQRNRAPVTFRWARAQIAQCACDGGRSRDSVNSNPPRRVVALDRF
jgi:hypothetical protein